MFLSGSVMADYPPDWGYDYIVRSLRTELYRDSTIVAGWAYLDSVTARYAVMDSLTVVSMVGTNLDLSGWLNADSIDGDHGNITELVSDSLDVDHISGITTIDPASELVIDGEDVSIIDSGTGVPSPYLYLKGDHGGVTERAAIRLVQGVDPYMELSVDDDNTMPALTSVLKMHDTALLFSTDNVTDIGATGATRPKDLYLAGSIQEAVNGTFSGYLDTDSSDVNHLVVNTTAALGASVSTDSSATVNLNTNVINWGASTTGDQDGQIIFNEADDTWILEVNDGLDAWHFPSQNVYVGGSYFSMYVNASNYTRIQNIGVFETRGYNITVDPINNGIGLINMGGNEADTVDFRVNDFVRFNSAPIFAEISTPSAITDYGRVYPKSDNQLYFLDGEGVEHLISLGSSDYGEMGNIFGDNATEIIHSADEWHGMFHANITGAPPHLNSGFTFVAGSEGSGSVTTAQGGAGINIADLSHGLVDGDIICVQSANHVGIDTVTYVDIGNFEITIGYLANEAATWQQGSYLLCATSGIYRGAWNASFSQSLNNTQTSLIAPYINTHQSTKAVASRLLTNNTDVGSIGGNGLMNFVNGDRIWFACQTTASQTLTFTIRNVSIH
jgi:hypothetical protein